MHLEHAGTAHWAESRSLLSEDSPSRGFTEEKNLSNSVWCGPWTASVLKPFMDVVLTMRASRIQQLSSCCTGSVERCFTDLIFARLWGGCCYPCHTNEEVEAHKGMLRSHSWEGAWYGRGPHSLWLFPLAVLLLWVVCGMWSRPNVIWFILKKQGFLKFYLIISFLRK